MLASMQGDRDMNGAHNMDEMITNRAFLQVAESGSFSAASIKLDVSVATVARQVNSLEALLGVKLMNRSTRALSLTEAGTLYCERIRDLMGDLDALKREVASYQRDVKGLLRVHLRRSVGSQVIAPVLPDFLKANPDVKLEVTLTDERADLVALGIDVAVWLGELQESRLIARKLSPGNRVICCSPAYAETHGLPKTPQELSQHNCIVYLAKSYDSSWRLTAGGKTTTVDVSGNLKSESSAVLMVSALDGLGLVMVQESMVRKAIASGELLNVFPSFQVSSTNTNVGLYAVYSGRKKLSPKTRAFIDFLVNVFRD
jgi:DNA-binding transcriptional LysR family regulator